MNCTHSSFYSCTCCSAGTVELALIQPFFQFPYAQAYFTETLDYMKVIYNFKQTFLSGSLWFAKIFHYIINVRSNSTNHKFHSHTIDRNTKPVSFLPPLEKACCISSSQLLDRQMIFNQQLKNFIYLASGKGRRLTCMTNRTTQVILNDASHPVYTEFESIPSGWCFRVPAAKISTRDYFWEEEEENGVIILIVRLYNCIY